MPLIVQHFVGIFNAYQANKYDAFFETKKGKYIYEVETRDLLNMLHLKPGMRILEIGSGTGLYITKFAKQGIKMVGIDISEHMTAIAQQKIDHLELDAEVHVMDANHIDFPENYFDAAFSMGVFDFIEQPENVYQSISKVVKPGGKIVIATVNRESQYGELYMSPEFNKGKVYAHAHFKSMDDLVAMRPDHVFQKSACLFVAYDAEESMFTLEKEEELRNKIAGGWITVGFTNKK